MRTDAFGSSKTTAALLQRRVAKKICFKVKWYLTIDLLIVLLEEIALEVGIIGRRYQYGSRDEEEESEHNEIHGTRPGHTSLRYRRDPGRLSLHHRHGDICYLNLQEFVAL